MNFNFAFATDVGRKRSQNQDSGGAYPELGLFIVSDGMGGHKGGETASATAVKVINEFVAKEVKKKNWDPRTTITRAIESANQAIFEIAQKTPELKGMGTTTTALLFKGDSVAIGHVGDSRCYFLRPNDIWQATRDHSLVQEKLRAGLITRQKLKTDRMRNVITRSVGYEKKVDVEVYQMEVKTNDCFLLCSDGLSGLMEDSRILELVQNRLFQEGQIQQGVLDLIAEANKNGGDDNITSVLVQVT